MKAAYARFTALVILAAVVAVWVATAGPADGSTIGVERYSLHRVAWKVAGSYLAVLSCYVVLGRQAWRRRAARAALNLAAILFAVLLVELPALLGWVDYRVLLTPKHVGGSGRHNMQLDPELLFHRPPHDRFVSRQPGDWTISLGIATDRCYEAEYRYDNNGFRNPTDLKRAGVVLLGDSFVEGYAVRQKVTCAAKLGRLLEVDVANLGQSDYGPPQQLVALRRFGLGLRPGVVVWCFFEGNDLGDLSDYEAAKRDWEGFVDRAEGFARRSFTRVALARLSVWVDRLRWRDSDVARRRSAQLLSEIRAGGATMYFETMPCEMTSRELALLAKTQRILQQAKSTCDRSGIRLLVVHVPLKFRVYHDLCILPDDGDLRGWKLNDLPDRLEQWCKASKVDYLDLTPALKSAAREGPLVYFLDDGHWTGDGHAVAAEQIAESIRKAGWSVPTRFTRPG